MGKLERDDDLTQNPDVPLDSSPRCELYYTELNDGPFGLNMSGLKNCNTRSLQIRLEILVYYRMQMTI